MKLIHNFKSPNFNERKSDNIEIIVIHYTALSSISNSLKYLCSKKNKVSSHYLISQTGKIYSLVSEKKRAWHAGHSYWRGNRDINSISIGIELDYSPLDSNNKFSSRLNSALIFLLKKLIKKYKIRIENVLGHSDIAPYRKIDPGKTFPWKKLCNLDLSYNPKKVSLMESKKIRMWFKKNKIYSNKNKILIMLNFIGYDISKSINNQNSYKSLINSYKSHYLQKSNTKNSKTKLSDSIEKHFCSLLLTKT